jgi:hypothetical protein
VAFVRHCGLKDARVAGRLGGVCTSLRIDCISVGAGQLIVPTLRVATQVQAHRASQTIRVQTGETTRSVAGCIPTPSVGTTKDAQAVRRRPYGIAD